MKREHNTDLMERAKTLINDYCEKEFFAPADFSNLSKVGIGYTTLTDDEVPTQSYVDLVNFRVDRYLNEVLVDRRQYGSLEELIKSELVCLDFSELIYFTDEQYAKAGC